MSVLLFFIDGLGIGARGPSNPFNGIENETAPLAVFQNETSSTIFDGVVVPTDACLGVTGRPQSASGQTTILTGINAPAALGHHKQGFPNRALLEIIREHSIFRQLTNAGVAPITFANAYTKRFFDTRPRWVSATTAAMEAGAIKFRTVEDLRSGQAVFHDFSNAALLERGEAVSLRTAAEAATVLAEIVDGNQFTLYEYFITDKIGHAQDYQEAQRVLINLAQFIRCLIARLDLKRTTVILTSDHGNIEDLSIRNHTLNEVPTIVWGAAQDSVARRVHSLADITPAILEVLNAKGTNTHGRINPFALA